MKTLRAHQLSCVGPFWPQLDPGWSAHRRAPRATPGFLPDHHAALRADHAHQPERIAGQVYERFAVFAEREMKSFPEMTQRILSIELTREVFVSGESHRHKNQQQTFNVQRPTSNAEFRNRQPYVGPGSQHSTINHQLL